MIGQAYGITLIKTTTYFIYSLNKMQKLFRCRGHSRVRCGYMIHYYILIIRLMLQSRLNATVENMSVPIWPALQARSI